MREPPELAQLRGWAAELDTELGGRAGVAAVKAQPRVTSFEVLRALQLRGSASIEELTAVLGTNGDEVRAALEMVKELVGTTPRGLQLAAAGRTWLAAALAEERSSLDAAVLERVYREFTVLDGALKQIVTDWQVRGVDGKPVPNDHRDATYDAAVLCRFAALHESFRPVFARAIEAAPRLARYGTRLELAAAAIAIGDPTMIATPFRDSYHSVWFEFHEELLGLVGKDRLAEERTIIKA